MSQYHQNSHRDSECKCKHCQIRDHVHQQKINHQRINNNYQQASHPVTRGHLSGGGGAPPIPEGGMACLYARGKSPARYQTVEQPICHSNVGNKCTMVEDTMDCRKNRFQELRKTWSEFARVCNCPNCKGSLQKERYLGKLAESADRASACKEHHNMNCIDECCCSADNIPSCNPHRHKTTRPSSRLYEYNYDQDQHDEYYGQHQQKRHQNLQQMQPILYQEVSSDEQLNCPGNIGCKCVTCSCRSPQKMYRDSGDGGGANSPVVVVEGMGPKHGGVKKEKTRHHYY